MVPGDIVKVINAYFRKYDVFNIKAAIHAVPTGKKARLIPIGVISEAGLLDNLAEARSLDDVLTVLEYAGLGNYAALLRDYRIDGTGRSQLLTEAKLDNEYFRELRERGRHVGDGKVLTKVIGTLVDMRNLNIIFRAVLGGGNTDAVDYTVMGGYLITPEKTLELLGTKLKDIPARMPYEYRGLADEVVSAYERTKSVTVIGEVVNRHEYRILRDMLSMVMMSPLNIMWFLLLKEIEVRNLRMILKLVFDKLPTEEVKSLVVSA